MAKIFCYSITRLTSILSVILILGMIVAPLPVIAFKQGGWLGTRLNFNGRGELYDINGDGLRSKLGLSLIVDTVGENSVGGTGKGKILS
jgi:hypothetical protein